MNADWSVHWHGWTELIGQVAELETERVKLIAAYEADAQDMHIEAVERNFIDRASAFVNVTLRQFYVLSDQNAPFPVCSDLQRCEELRSHMVCIVEAGRFGIGMIAARTVSFSCSLSMECFRTKSLLLAAMLHAWQIAVRFGLRQTH